MNAAMLKFALRGKGLTEEQLDCAALRLGQLQEAIRKGEEHYKDRDLAADLKQKKEKTECQAYDEGFLRTVPDEAFKDLSIQRLCDPKPINKQGWRKNRYHREDPEGEAGQADVQGLYRRCFRGFQLCQLQA